MPHWDAQDYAQSWSPEAYYPNGGQLGTGGLYDPLGVGRKHAGGKLAWPALSSVCALQLGSRSIDENSEITSDTRS